MLVLQLFEQTPLLGSVRHWPKRKGPTPDQLASILMPAPRVVPVATFIQGIGDCIRSQLQSHSASHAAQLFRSGQLQVVDIPIPRLVGNKQNPVTGPYEEDPGRPLWELTQQQQEIVRNAEIVVMDEHSGGPLLLAPQENLPEGMQTILERLQWVQGTYAGVEMYLDQLERNKQTGEGVTDPKFTVTRAGGYMSRLIGQYVFGYVTMLERKFLQGMEFQAKREYDRLAMWEYRSPRAVTVGVLGLGDIGSGIGRMLRSAGYRVIGYKRRLNAASADDLDSVLPAADVVTDQLDDVLEQCDYLVSVLPSTTETQGLLTSERLDKCRARRPVFINVGRGDVISESVLLKELSSDDGALSFAVLDVFEQEPLPKTSELYTHPRVLLTPHVAGKVFPDDVAELFVDNLDRYLTGKPVRYAVDWTLGY